MKFTSIRTISFPKFAVLSILGFSIYYFNIFPKLVNLVFGLPIITLEVIATVGISLFFELIMMNFIMFNHKQNQAPTFTGIYLKIPIWLKILVIIAVSYIIVSFHIYGNLQHSYLSGSVSLGMQSFDASMASKKTPTFNSEFFRVSAYSIFIEIIFSLNSLMTGTGILGRLSRKLKLEQGIISIIRKTPLVPWKLFDMNYQEMEAYFTKHSRKFGIQIDRRFNMSHIEYAQSIFPLKEYPTYYVKIPEDIRKPIAFYGKLLNGDSITSTGYKFIDYEVLDRALKANKEIALSVMTYGVVLGLGILFLTGNIFSALNVPFPSWAGYFSIPVASWIIMNSINLLLSSLGFFIMIPLIVYSSILLGFTTLPLTMMMQMQAYLDMATKNLRMPTRDEKDYHNNLNTIQMKIGNYKRHIKNAIELETK
jgi:hypothetical protein